jgi:hypothetical protein
MTTIFFRGVWISRSRSIACIICLPDLLDHRLNSPIGVDPDPHLSPSAVPHRVLTFPVGVLRLPPRILLNLADGPLGIVPDCHRSPFGGPGTGLLATQNYHHVVVLEIIRLADIPEMGDVRTA